MEEHPLVTRFPEDANWEYFNQSTLRKQCSERNIPNDETSWYDMIRLLQKYQKKHVTEVRKIPWRSPDFGTHFEKSRSLSKTFQVTQVKDMNCGEAALKVRKLKQASRCWVCEDTAEWDIEKHREQNHIPAATTTATIAPAPPTPTTNLVQQSIKRKDKDNHGMGNSSPSKKQDNRDTQVNNPEVNQRPIPSSTIVRIFLLLVIQLSTPSQSAVNQQELLPPPSPQQPSQASKDVAPQLKGSTSLAVPLQRSTSAPLTSNQEPMWHEVEQKKELERVGKPLRGVSQDCSPALAKSLSSVPSVQYPIPTASAARARSVGQAGQTLVLSAVGIESHNSAATAAPVSVQAATPVPPGGTPGVVGCPSPVSNMNADVHKRKTARLVRKCRRLEKESARIGKRVKRGIENIDREYKQELEMLKEKRMRIEKKWERGLKGLKDKREKLEQKLKALD
ncbi:hypothetical protein N0V85_003474 [Neurospora sp. IMI 360204]|nr:hypothetical protein N0V85_003474 [Neurospora sp. IMI 360204]